MSRGIRVLAGVLALGTCVALGAQDAQQVVEQAVKTELAADASDHSRWLYYEIERKPGRTVKQWAATTGQGELDRIMEENGRVLNQKEQRGRMEGFMRDSSAQEKQRKAGQHDDQQASQMLKMLPQAFIWTKTGTQGNLTLLHFKPNLRFHPPTYEARVFAAMEGDMAVDTAQHRIASLKGRMIHEVKFGWGLMGELDPGGTFNVERRQTGGGVWQITETHVHIRGHALLFKNISDQEDDVKSEFKELPQTLSFLDAENRLMQQGV